MEQVLRRKFWAIADILRSDGLNPVTSIEQISYLIYLKLLDEEEENHARIFPRQAARYRWSKWHCKSAEDLQYFLQNEVFYYLASLVKDAPEVAEYFRDAELKIVNPNSLKQAIDELDSVNFSLINPKIKGEVFEELLTHFGKLALNGQFRTPSQIRKLMVEMLAPILGETIYDPACGTGGFLIEAANYILEKSKSTEEQEKPEKDEFDKFSERNVLENLIYGVEISRPIVRIAIVELALHGMRKARLKRANVLSDRDGLTEEDLHRRYQVILCDPPFAGQPLQKFIRKDLATNSNKAELLFLALMMASLNLGGRCAILVPEGLLEGITEAHVDLRKKWVTDFEILAVVSLPNGILNPYTNIKTSIVIFRKPLEKRKVKNIWFYEVKSNGNGLENSDLSETPELINISELIELWENYKKSNFENTPGEKAGKIIETDSEESTNWWGSIEAIAKNNYNLTAGSYKPRVAEERAKVLMSQSRILLQQKRLDEAEETIRQSLAIFEQLGDQRSVALNLHILSNVLRQQRRFQEAEKLLRRSLEIGEVLGDLRHQAMVLDNMGGVLQQQGHFYEALEAIIRSIEISLILGDRRLLANVMNNLVWVLEKQGHFQKVLDAIGHRSRMDNQLADPRYLANGLNTLSRILEQVDRFDNDLDPLERPADRSKQFANQRSLALALNSLGKVLQLLGNLDEAKAVLRRSCEILDRIGDRVSLEKVLKHLDEVLQPLDPLEKLDV